MSVTLALTCPSLLKTLTSSKWDTFLPRGLLIAKYGMSHIFFHAISRLEGEREHHIFALSFFSWYQRHNLAGCRFLGLFHVVSYPAASSHWYYLAVLEVRDHISTILFRAFPHWGANASSHALLQTTHLRSALHMLARAHSLSKQQRRHPRCESAHKCKPQHPLVENWVMVLLLA